MAEKVPIRAIYDGSDTCGLSELRDGEVVGVEHGGLGACTFTADGVLLGNTQGAVQVSSALTTNGQLLIGGTSGPAVANITGTANEVDITNGDGTIAIGLPATVCVTTKVISPALCIASQYVLPSADGSAGQVMCTDGSGGIAFATNTPSSPGGSDTYVQFNDGSSFGGSANFTWDDTTLKATNLCTTANAVIGGDLTIAGDDLTMGTNTSGALLVADGTNFNPVVMSGDTSISTAGAVTLAATNTNLTTLANVTTVGTIGSGTWQGTAIATGYIATTLTGKTLTTATLTSPVLNGTLSGTAFLDEDNMASDSAIAAASQQSIKAYVDAVSSGLDMKASSHAATTSAFDSAAYDNGSSGVGATLCNSHYFAFSALSIDGQTMVAGERVLVKNQTAACHNGIYTVTTVGDGSTRWIITRATDFDSSTEVTSGAFTFIETGSTNGDQGFVMTADGTITIGTTAINWTQFSGAGQITAGAGMTKSGNTLNVIAGSNITVNADDVALSTTITGLSALTSTNLTGTLQTAAQANVTSVGTLTSLNSSGDVSFDGGTFVFNESGANKDFRIEGDTATNLFITDASTDRIGIGTATPSHLLDIEGVGHAATCFVSADLCATTKVVAAAICMGGGYALPTSDGTAGYILCTDGSGAVSFAEAASSGHTIAEDGSTLADRTCLNFCGTGVTVTDCSTTNSTDVKVDATGACMPIRVSAGTQCYACLATATIAAPCLQCDSAPKLGGSLDVNSNSIISASNGNIPITPNGSGIVIIDGLCHPIADGSAGQLLCTDGSAALKFATATAGVTLAGSTNNTIATVTGANALAGEANLTFNGTTLAVTGAATVSTDLTVATDAFFVDASADYAGIGVGTLNAFRTNFTGLQVGYAGSLTASKADGAGSAVWLGSNVYYNGSAFKYINSASDEASLLSMQDGGLLFQNAPVGTAAGADATLTSRFSISSAGNVGIGTTAPNARLTIWNSDVGTAEPHADADEFVIEGSASSGRNTGMSILACCEGMATINAGTCASNAYGMIQWNMSTGCFCFNNNGVNYFHMDYLGNANFCNQTSGGAGMSIASGSTTIPRGLAINFLCTTCTCQNSYYAYWYGGAGEKFIVMATGNVTNANNSYGAISDENRKQDITDARSYWDDFKGIRFRKFRFKSDVKEDANAPELFGVVAQELETVFPGLVEESTDKADREVPSLDKDGNQTHTTNEEGEQVPDTESKLTDLDTTTKSVKYSVLSQIGLKVIQELQIRLEAAESKATAQEAEIAILKG